MRAYALITTTPRWTHDCELCTFLGHWEGYDLYYAVRYTEHPSIIRCIARFGSGSSHYYSGHPTLLTNEAGSIDMNLPILIATFLAQEAGLIKEKPHAQDHLQRGVEPI